jgi:hypothetical protein
MLAVPADMFTIVAGYAIYRRATDWDAKFMGIAWMFNGFVVIWLMCSLSYGSLQPDNLSGLPLLALITDYVLLMIAVHRNVMMRNLSEDELEKELRKPGYVPHQWAALADALQWIHGSGGIAVLAHPGRYELGDAKRERLLGEFVERGGAAVEVVTGSHAPTEFVTWARHARNFGLLASAGSDFHGPGEGYRDIGNVPALPSGCDPVWARF